MKTNCTENTRHGADVTVGYVIPEQEDVDAGMKPSFGIDCLELLVAEEAGTLDEGCVGCFSVDAEEVFMEAAFNAEEAETVALWLERMAAAVRAKFLPSLDGLTIRQICVPVRAANILEREGVTLVSHLLQHSIVDLLKMPGFGRESAAAVAREVERFGGLSSESIRHLGGDLREDQAVVGLS